MRSLTNIFGQTNSGRFAGIAQIGWRVFGARVIAPPAVPEHPSALLARALDEGSNLEFDWVWYADQMADVDERRYCLDRARWINPSSEAARGDLR